MDKYNDMTENLALDMVDGAYAHQSGVRFNDWQNDGTLTILAKAHVCIGTTKIVVVRNGNILICA